MKIKELEKIHAKHDGNHSILFPYIKDEIEKMDYGEQDLPFAETFICFDDDYIKYCLDIKARDNKIRKIVDIGCQYGFQSYFFDDFDYIGIDSHIEQRLFFRNEGNYISGHFPYVNIDLSDSIVISNMSLGYFNNEKMNINNKTIAEKLNEANYLYIVTNSDLLDELKKNFVLIKTFDRSSDFSTNFPRMYLENKRLHEK